MEAKSKPLKIVIVGDKGTGKSSLCDFFNIYKTDTVGEIIEREIKGQKFYAYITDTPEAMRTADAFVICADLNNQKSLDSACKHWKREVKELGPKRCPQILCGTK